MLAADITRTTAQDISVFLSAGLKAGSAKRYLNQPVSPVTLPARPTGLALDTSRHYGVNSATLLH